MEGKIKEPHPAKSVARIDNQDRRDPDSVNIGTKNVVSNSATIRQDARVLQFLKKEYQRTGAGKDALTAVFTGLVSVHNRHLITFADALAKEAI